MVNTLHFTGLSNDVIPSLHVKWGLNVLPEKKPPTQGEIILEQLKSPLVYILLVAAVITFFLGDYEDSVIIGFAVFLNTVLGRYQESNAGKSLQALKELLQPTVTVLRDGQIQTIATRELVPGDIIICKSGAKIPADGVVKESTKLTVSEAMLTGESLPVEKKVGDIAYMGTVVLSGSAYIEITSIGSQTELGKIATSLQGEETITPLQKQLQYFSKQLTWVVVGITMGVFVIGLISGRSPIEIFTTAVALAVGAIPEGLLVALTVVLAVGMQKILQRKGLVKNLVSAETLGSVTVICSDKTGTLTHGTMEVIETIGDSTLLQKLISRSTEDDNAVSKALLSWIAKNAGGNDTSPEGTCIDISPFSSEHKYAATIYQELGKSEQVLYITGAAEYLMQWSILTETQKNDLHTQIEQYTQAGYRLVAAAQKIIPTTVRSIDTALINQGGFERVGLVCLADPIREDVKEALEKTQKAGIKLVVITGDYPGTARAIMEKLGVGVDADMVMTGERLMSISDEELDTWLASDGRIRLFARTQPAQKMRIVEALKNNGEVVAMMGDGVNDAPALKKADIGIVVAEATEVAKESADLILMDSSFSTIVAAIEEGRGMFENIRKVILYLLCDAFEEIIVITLCLFTLTPLPVSAAQILWINLISDGFPNLALTVDPKRKGLMSLAPRSPQEPLVNNWIKRLIIIVSIAGGIMCFFIFSRVLKLTNDLELARSVAFVTLGINSLIYVFSVKTLEVPFRKENILNNKRLLVAVVGGFMLQIIPFVFTGVGKFLDIVPIGNWRYAAFGASFMMFAIIELYKYGTIGRKKLS